MGIEQKENWSNEYLSSFKVASYVTKEEDEVNYIYIEILKLVTTHFVVLPLFVLIYYKMLVLSSIP